MVSITKRSAGGRTSEGPRSTEKFLAVPIARSFAQRLVEQEIIAFSWDNRNALWCGLVLTFSSSQLACFKVLWENFLRGNLPIPNERILCGLRGNTTHVYHLFKRHVAWKRVIIGDGRGNFWLCMPGGFTNPEGNLTTDPPRTPELISAAGLGSRSAISALDHGKGHGRRFFA